MKIEEAKQILNDSGYILKEAIDYDAWLTHNPADDYDGPDRYEMEEYAGKMFDEDYAPDEKKLLNDLQKDFPSVVSISYDFDDWDDIDEWTVYGKYNLNIGLDLGEDTIKQYREWYEDDNEEYAENGKKTEKLMVDVANKVSDYLEGVEEAEWIDYKVDEENPNIIIMKCDCTVSVDTESHFNPEPDYDYDPPEPDYGDYW